MSKEELINKYQEIILKTNGGNNDYIVAICQISNLINEFAIYQEQLISDLQSQLSITEKALELACDKLPMEAEYCCDNIERYNLQDEYGSDEPYWVEEHSCEFSSPEDCLKCVFNYFIDKAKVIMKEKNEKTTLYNRI